MTGKDEHTISLIVNNKPGALIRVAQVFTRRSFNINSINVSPTLDGKYSRMTITSYGARETVRQIVLQLEKLVDVIQAIEHTREETTNRELALVKIECENSQVLQKEQMPNVELMIVEELENHVIIQLTGETDSIDAAVQYLKVNHKIVELLRSGTVAITHANISYT